MTTPNNRSAPVDASAPATSIRPAGPSQHAETRRRIHACPAVSYDSSARLLRFKEGTDDEGVAAARMTLRSEPAGDEARAAMIAARSSMPASSAKKMTEYVPDLPAEQVNVIRPFVEDAITLALPQNSYSVEALLGPCMHFAYWAVFVVGADLDASIIFDRELIEHYVRESLPELAEGTRRNHRAWLFRVAEAVNPEANPRNPMPLNERSLDTPYDDDERTALDHWAAGQATPYMRQAATVLIALGIGAGLSSGEIATLRRESVTEGPDRVVSIELPGEDKPRIVPVTARYEKALAKAIKKVPAGAFVFLPNRTRTGNEVVSAWVARSLTPPGTPTVRVRRMRNTWLVTHMANRVDVLTLMEAAGLQSLESISRLAAFVPRPSEDARTAQLRGTK